MQERLISAKKLIEYIDKLEDAINSGQLDADDSRIKLITEAVKCPSCGATSTVNLKNKKLPDIDWLKCNSCGEHPVIADWKQSNPELS